MSDTTWVEYDRANALLDQQQQLESPLAGMERFNPNQFHLQFDIFKLMHLSQSRILQLDPKMQLPNHSIIHLLDAVMDPNNIHDTPNWEAEPFCVQESYRRVLYHLRGPDLAGPITIDKSSYIYRMAQLPTNLMQFRKKASNAFIYSSSLETLGNYGDQSLFVINHNPVWRLKVYGARLAFHRKLIAVYSSVLNTCATLAKLYPQRRQFIVIPWGPETFAKNEFFQALKDFNPSTIKHPNSYHYLMMMQLVTYIWKEGTPSIFNQVDTSVLEKITFIIRSHDKLIFLNLPALLAMGDRTLVVYRLINQLNLLSVISRNAESPAVKKIIKETEVRTDEGRLVSKPIITQGLSIGKGLDINFSQVMDTDRGATPENKLEEAIDEAAKIAPAEAEPVASDLHAAVDKQEVATPEVSPAPKNNSVIRRSVVPPRVKFDVTKYRTQTEVRETSTVDTYTKEFVDILDKRANDLIDSAPILTPKQRLGLKKIAQRYKHLEFNGSTIGKILEQEVDTKVDTNVLGDNVIANPLDPSVKESRVMALDRTYMDKIYLRQLLAIVTSFRAEGVYLTDIKADKHVDPINSNTTYICRFMDIHGKGSTIRFKVPNVDRHGRFKIDGVESVLLKQRINNPIVKISDTEVSLSSNYNKARVIRNTTVAHSFFSYIDKIINTKKATASVHYGNCVVNEPISYEYSTLAERYSFVEFTDDDSVSWELFFEYPQRMKHAGIKEALFTKLEKEYGVYFGKTNTRLLFINANNEVSATTFDGSEDVNFTDDTITKICLKALRPESPLPKPLTEWVVFKNLDIDLPVIYVLAYRFGLRRVLDMLDMDYVITERRSKTITSEGIAAGTESLSQDNAQGTVDDLKSVMSAFSGVKYGIYDTKTNGIMSDDVTDVYRNTYGRVLTPDEVLSMRIGTCWDQSLAVAHYLEQKNIQYYYVYLEQLKGITHACVIAELPNGFYWLESAWSGHYGVHGPYKTLENAVSEIATAQVSDGDNNSYILTAKIVSSSVVQELQSNKHLQLSEYLNAVGSQFHLFRRDTVSDVKTSGIFVEEIIYQNKPSVKVNSREYLATSEGIAGQESMDVRYKVRPSDISIKFADRILWFNRYPLSKSLIVAGLAAFDLETYNLVEFEDKEVYYRILMDMGKSINYLKGIDSFFDLFIDPITYNVLRKMQEPTTPEGLLIRSAQLLSTRDYRPAASSYNYRIRGYEQFNAILYNEMARAVHAWQTNKSRANTFTINPEAVYLKIVTNAAVLSTDLANPMQDIKMSASMTFAGTGGRSAESFVIEDRRYLADDIGIMALDTSDNQKVGMNSQLTINANVMDTDGILKVTDGEGCSPSNAFSMSTLVSPYSTHEDFKRMNFIGIQMGHMISVEHTDRSRVRTGYERVIGQYCSRKFASVAEQNGKVTNIDPVAKTVEVTYADNTVDIFPYGEDYTEHESVCVTIDLVCNVKVGDTIRKGDVICYDQKYFKRSPMDNQIDFSIGATANTVLMETDVDLEDACCMSKRLAAKMAITPTNMRVVSLPANSIIHKCVKVGDTVAHSDDLMIFEEDYSVGGSSDTDMFKGDSDTLALLGELNHKTPEAKYAGKIVRIDALYSCQPAEMHPTLQNIVREAVARDTRRARNAQSTTAMDDFPMPKPIPVDSKVKGVTFDDKTVMLIFYIQEKQATQVGDKCVLGLQLKHTISYLMPQPQYTGDGEEIDVIFSADAVGRRIVLSAKFMGITNRIMEKLEQNIVDMYFK